MSTAMQRLASSFTAEITTTTVDLPSDEMKDVLSAEKVVILKRLKT